jgi:GNAT superfamily N-acetyltransferase
MPTPISQPGYYSSSKSQPSLSGKDYRIRPLKRGDREPVFRLLSDDGWVVPAHDQENVLSWVVQHPEMESFVAHDVISFSRVIGAITMSHRPQLRLGGRVASIDLFVVEEARRGQGVGTDLLVQALRRSEALACKRVELHLSLPHGAQHEFFEQHGFVKNAAELYVRQNRPLERISQPHPTSR